IVDGAPACQRNWPRRRARPRRPGPSPACRTRAGRDAEIPDSGTRHLPRDLRWPRNSCRSTPGSEERAGPTRSRPSLNQAWLEPPGTRRAGRRHRRPERTHPYGPASSVNQLARDWTGRLAHYATHRNDEHRLALLEEATRYAGLHLENDLARSEFWSRSPLHQRAAVLLFLVDRGVVERTTRRGRRVYEPLAHAESWCHDQPSLRPHRGPVLEFLGALRLELQRRAHSRHV